MLLQEATLQEAKIPRVRKKEKMPGGTPLVLQNFRPKTQSMKKTTGPVLRERLKITGAKRRIFLSGPNGSRQS
jgi:hypothetical protein